MTTPPQSIKEYWQDPKRDRRKSGGRRDSDYSVCQMHDSQQEHFCGKLKSLKEEHDKEVKTIWSSLEALRSDIVGKFTFRLMIGVVAGAIGLISISNTWMMQKIVTDIDHLRAAVAVLVYKDRD